MSLTARFGRWAGLSALLWQIIVCNTGAEPVRLAIVAEAPEFRVAADLLTTTFSTNSQVVLVEREQLAKILQEQALSADQARDFVKLGRLLGADGLLILQAPDSGDRPELVAALLAVKPGVLLREAAYPWPAPYLERWAELVQRQVQPFLPKLAVLPRDAVPVSILNLRASVNSAEATALERELTLLLRAHLVRQPEVFVLERRRLHNLTFEKELDGRSEAPFWSGGYLLEGLINKEGFASNTVTISGRIVPPDKTNSIVLDLSGPRTNLTALADELCRRILAAIKPKGTVPPWAPLAEADRYLEEAKWAFRWGMLPEAAAACESCWSLGRQTPEVAELRIRAYRDYGGLPGRCVVEYWTRHLVFVRSWKPPVENSAQVPPSSGPSDVERFASLLRALELYAESQRLFPASNLQSSAWFNLGTELVEYGGWWLRFFYFNPEARDGQAEPIAACKRLSREVLETMAAHPPALAAHELTMQASQDGWELGNVPGYVFTNSAGLLLQIKARHTAFWTDNSEQTLAVYRKLAATGDWPHMRTRFLNHAEAEHRLDRTQIGGSTSTAGPYANAASPCLAGWTLAERLRCPALWSGFLDELASSTNPLVRLEGLYLRCSHAWSEVECEPAMRQLFEAVWQLPEPVITSDFGTTLLRDLETLVTLRSEHLSGPRLELAEKKSAEIKQRQQTLDAARKRRAQELAETQKKREQEEAELKARQDRALWLEAQKSYMRTQTTYNFFWFARDMMSQGYQSNEAQQLLPLLLDYRARLDQQAKTNPVRRSYAFQFDHLERRLRDTIKPPPATNHPPPPATNAAPRLAAPAPRKTLQDLAFTNVLQVARFWKIPGSPPTEYVRVRPPVPHVLGARFREGRLWVQVIYSESMIEATDFMSVDLDTLRANESHRFTMPENYGWPLWEFCEPAEPFFEIFQGTLYVLPPRLAYRKDLRQEHWESFPLPDVGSAQAHRLGDRLFFLTAGSILEYLREGEWRVLASTRRRPAQSELDSLERYASWKFGWPNLFVTPRGELRVCINGQVYALAPGNTNQWRSLVKSPARLAGAFETGMLAGPGYTRMLPGAAYFEDYTSSVWIVDMGGTQLWRLDGEETGFELLLSGNPSPAPRAPAGPNTPCWMLPEGVSSLDLPRCVDGESIWFLAGALDFQQDAAHRLRLNETNGWQVLLLRYARGMTSPVRIPLRLEIDPTVFSSYAAGALPGAGRKRILLQSTPKGLVITRTLVPGVWFIPKAELEPYIRAEEERVRVAREAEQKRNADVKQGFLSTYDRNRNGVLDPAEKLAAMDNPAFLKMELPNLDTNHNDMLDVEELGFFDANSNSQLDPAEGVALELCLTNLAAHLLVEWDRNQNGRLEYGELNPEWRRSRFTNPVGDDISQARVASLLQLHLISQLSMAAPRARPGFFRFGMNGQTKVLEDLIGEHWKGGSKLSATNAPPTNVQPAQPTKRL